MLKRIKQLIFYNRSTRQTVAKNTFWLSVSEIGARFIRAFVIIYAARVLGAENFGVFSYALGLAGFFTIFADTGISQLLTREASQKPDMRSNYFATAFSIKLVLLSATSLFIIFVAPYFSRIEAAKALIPFIALLTIADGIREFSLAFFRAMEKMELQALITFITNISIAFFGLIVLYFYATAPALALTYIASAGVGAGAAVLLLRREFLQIFRFFDKKLIYPLLKSAWPIALISTLGAFMLNVDIMMLGWLKDAETVGLYSASQKIVAILYTIPGILAMALFPTLSRFIGNEAPERVRLLIERAMSLAFALALPMVVGGIILSEEIIALVYGAEFAPAAESFRILMATLLFIFPGTQVGNMIMAYDKQKKVAVFIGLASLSNAVLNYLLIPIYGIAGAAIATLTAQGVSNGGVWIMAKRTNNFTTFRNLKKIAFATAAMGIASYSLNVAGLNPIITICLSAVFYGGILYLLKERIAMEVAGLLKTI